MMWPPPFESHSLEALEPPAHLFLSEGNGQLLPSPSYLPNSKDAVNLMGTQESSGLVSHPALWLVTTDLSQDLG